MGIAFPFRFFQCDIIGLNYSTIFANTYDFSVTQLAGVVGLFVQTQRDYS